MIKTTTHPTRVYLDGRDPELLGYAAAALTEELGVRVVNFGATRRDVDLVLAADVVVYTGSAVDPVVATLAGAAGLPTVPLCSGAVPLRLGLLTGL